MADMLYIRELEVWTRLGVPEAERAEPQRVEVNVWLGMDCARVAETDDVAQGFDYDVALRLVKDVAAAGERRTLEKFVEDCATVLRTLGASSVTVSATKFPSSHPQGITLTVTRP